MNAAFPLLRDPARLRSQPFDLLVIGGGIYGAWTAYDAAQRGLSVALIEREDWASGTSSASSKLIHGGLRYLEHYDFALVRHALAERRTLTSIAPHLVRPLEFIVPVHKQSRAGMLKFSAGLTLYDWLGGLKQPVARHRHLSASRLMLRYPFMNAYQLRGGFSFGDCQEDDARLTLTVVAAAQAHGAVCANRIEAQRWLDASGMPSAPADTQSATPATPPSSVHGALAVDRLTGRSLPIHARQTVVAAGPWSVAQLGPLSPPIKLIKGVHLLLPKIPGCDQAFLLTSPDDGRVLFVIPWYGRTLVGTTESTVQDPREAEVLPADVQYLLTAVAANLPGLRWTTRDVIASFAGVRTLQADTSTSLSAVSREFDLHDIVPGLLLPLGGKYTTARSDAIAIIDRIESLLGRPITASRTGLSPLPGAPQGPLHNWLEAMMREPALAHLPAEHRNTLLLRHGTRSAEIIDMISADPRLGELLHPSTPFIAAEIELALRDEMAISSEDVLRRRMPLQLLLGHSARMDEVKHQLDLRLAGTARLAG